MLERLHALQAKANEENNHTNSNISARDDGNYKFCTLEFINLF